MQTKRKEPLHADLNATSSVFTVLYNYISG